MTTDHDHADHDHAAHAHAAHAHDEGAAAGQAGHGGHGHDHTSGMIQAGDRYKRPLAMSLALILAFLVVQVVTGLVINSLALLSDAGHMATDALGLGMALAAIVASSKGSRDGQRTYGLYRLEVLAALANAVLLVGVGLYVLVEAVLRLRDLPDVPSTPVLVVGVVGLVVNLISFLLLRSGAKENMNMKGAYLEVVSDALGSVGVILAALIMMATGWAWVDPLIGAAIGLFIVPRSLRLGRDAVRVLVQSAPAGMDVNAVRRDLAAVPGVLDVHDLHIWTLTSQMDVASAHLVIRAGDDGHGVLDRARDLLVTRYHLEHATLQVEPDDHTGCDEISW